MIKYGNYMFYAQLDYVSYLQHGHELYLTSNGVVLAYKNIAPMYLTHHYRPPHEKDPGGLKYEQKQQGARASSSHEEAAPGASASASASGGSPQEEEPARGSNILRRCPGRSARPMLRPPLMRQCQREALHRGRYPHLTLLVFRS